VNKIAIHGQAGEVRWGYHPAATLAAWTITMDPLGGDLTGEVVSADALRTSQPSLTFEVVRQNAPSWSWPVLSLHIADGRLSARLGLQE